VDADADARNIDIGAARDEKFVIACRFARLERFEHRSRRSRRALDPSAMIKPREAPPKPRSRCMRARSARAITTAQAHSSVVARCRG